MHVRMQIAYDTCSMPKACFFSLLKPRQLMITHCTKTMDSVVHNIPVIVVFHELRTMKSTHKKYFTEILFTPLEREKPSDYSDIKYVQENYSLWLQLQKIPLLTAGLFHVDRDCNNKRYLSYKFIDTQDSKLVLWKSF